MIFSDCKRHKIHAETTLYCILLCFLRRNLSWDGNVAQKGGKNIHRTTNYAEQNHSWETGSHSA